MLPSFSLLLSDLSTILIGPLNNNGSDTTFTFPATTFSSFTLLVTNVSSTTGNVGLQEIKVYAPTTTSASAPALSPPLATPFSTPSTVNGSVVIDLARLAFAEASSSSKDQGPEKAIDGVVSGYTPGGGDYTREWASYGQGLGATLILTWPTPITASSLVTFDRPNLADNILGATITFLP